MKDEDEADEEAWLVACLKDCTCCIECGGAGRPCAGVQAGGLCDRMCCCNDDPPEDGGENDDERDPWASGGHPS